jgi:peptidoglycan hydrolase-like protein with peptidoglycan-binding domain
MFLPTNNSTGEEVKFWQHMLEELGFTPGEIDGEYGPKTQAAVAAFRKSLGVTTNYTYLTSWTAFAMFRALAEKYAGKDGEPGKNGKDGKDGADVQNGTLTGTLSVTGGSLNVEAV